MSAHETHRSIDTLLADRQFVRRLARRLVGDAHLADDLEQRTWLAAMKRPPREGVPVRSWLATVMRNAARNMWRERTRRAAREEAVARPASVTADASNIVAQAEEGKRVIERVLDLEEPYRTTVLLRFFEDLPPREVAQRMDVPVETVRTRTRRALARLRERFDEEYAGDRRAWCLALLPLASGAPPMPAGTGGATGAASSATQVLVTAAGVAALSIAVVAVATWSTDGTPGARRSAAVAAERPDVESAEGETFAQRDRSRTRARTLADGAATDAATEPRTPASVRPAPGAGETGDPVPVAPPWLAGVVMDPDGEAVPGAIVAVHWPGASSDTHPVAITLQWLLNARRLRADAEGRFSVAKLPPGPYLLVASAEGLVSTTLSDVQRGEDDLVLGLGPGATIRGRVILEGDGGPAAGVAIEHSTDAGLPSVDAVKRLFDASRGVMSEDDGSFELRGLAPGTYELRARAADGPPGERVRVEVQSGAAIEGVVLVAPFGRVARGIVVDAAGRPVAGARVFTGQGGTVVMLPMSLRSRRSTTSGPDGRFVLEGLPAGRVTLQATAEGHAPAIVEGADASIDDVRLALGEPASVEGRVRDANGEPIAGAPVAVRTATGGSAGFAMTNADGVYRIDDLAEGAAQVVLVRAGAPPTLGGVRAVALRAGETRQVDFGGQTGGVTVRGTLLRGGRPFGGGQVLLIGGPSVLASPVAADGTFRFDGVTPGRRTLLREGTAFTREIEIEGDGRDVTLRGDVPVGEIRGLVVDANGSPMALAQVIVLVDGVARARAVAGWAAKYSALTLTGPDGRFTVRGVRDAEMALLIQGAGHAPRIQEGLRPGREEVRLQLQRGAPVDIRIETPEGVTLPGAAVYAVDARGREIVLGGGDVSADDDGVVRTRLATGRYTLHGVAAGRVPSATVLDVNGAGSATLQLPRAGGFALRAVAADGTPLTEAHVRVLVGGSELPPRPAPDALLGVRDHTDVRGEMSRGELPPGHVTLEVTAADGSTRTERIAIEAGETTPVTIRF